MLNKYKILSLILLCVGVQASADVVEFEQGGILFRSDTLTVDETDVTVLGFADEGKYPQDLTIPSMIENEGVTYSVTSIADKAFFMKSLRKVDIPASVYRIGASAFAIDYSHDYTYEKHIPDTVVLRSKTPPMAWAVSEYSESETQKKYVVGDIFNVNFMTIWWPDYDIKHGSATVPGITFNGPEFREDFDSLMYNRRFIEIKSTLIVPQEALPVYKSLCSYKFDESTLTTGYTTDVWGRFKAYNTIENMENSIKGENSNQTNGIDSAMDDTSLLTSDLYDLAGRLVIRNFNGEQPDWLAPGIYIYRGRKVVVR